MTNNDNIYESCLKFAEYQIDKFAVHSDGNATERLFETRLSTAVRLHEHAISEAVGSAVIMQVAKFQENPKTKQVLEDHAKDESRHSRLLKMAGDEIGDFPVGKLSKVLERAKSEIGNFDGNMGNFYCSMHVAELRNLFVLRDYIARISKMEVSYSAKLVSLFQEILSDEMRHVEYTRVLLLPWLRKSSNNVQTFMEYVRLHKGIVLSETERALDKLTTLESDVSDSTGGYYAQ